MTSSLQLRSFAKINWTLDVLYKRDDGFHELRTIYQTVSLHDTIKLNSTSGEIQVICDDPRVPAGETNLAHKAAIALREATGTGAGVRIEIQKRIPVAGGLGGGSSNAAATLMGLVRLWGLKVAEVELLELGAGLGSDVPLFLIGGTLLGVGRGEEVYPIEQCESRDIALVNPGVEVSTAEAYTRLSRLTMHRGALTMPFALLAAKGIRELPLRVRNDLEDAVLPAHPEIAEVKRRLLSTGARPALMSGSGATVYGVFDNSVTLKQALAEMRGLGFWAEGVRTINRQEYQRTIFE
ncbi:MAG TPA: 4-(cytidine 5'-diphospho)-2-C-methyl-D-erythritol kinase [Blastocatellia bacterium]|nr:4-(cytidine 5'-diphospho)-2-C-methyl-D-erythritol kinase [Blastocatellia bacterium]